MGLLQPEIKEKVVVQESGAQYGGEIPNLVPMQRRSLAELKKMEQSQEKRDSLYEKSSLLHCKRNNLWKLQNQNLKLLEGVTLRLAGITKTEQKHPLWQRLKADQLHHRPVEKQW